MTSRRVSFITVSVTTVPGKKTEVTLNGDRTVAAACREAGIDPSGWTIQVGGEDASTTTQLYNGAQVVLAKNIKGN